LLQTYGFRGEALSALCAVAEVIIITKTKDDIVGNSYTMNHDGEIMEQELCHRSTGKNIHRFYSKYNNIDINIIVFMYFLRNINLLGTTVQIKNLFKHIPVRRQFISNIRRANQTIKLLETIIQGFGICKPNVRIQFRANNNIIFTKPSLNNIKEAANHILGRKIISHMEWIEHNDTEVGICFELM